MLPVIPGIGRKCVLSNSRDRRSTRCLYSFGPRGLLFRSVETKPFLQIRRPGSRRIIHTDRYCYPFEMRRRKPSAPRPISPAGKKASIAGSGTGSGPGPPPPQFAVQVTRVAQSCAPASLPSVRSAVKYVPVSKLLVLSRPRGATSTAGPRVRPPVARSAVDGDANEPKGGLTPPPVSKLNTPAEHTPFGVP